MNYKLGKHVKRITVWNEPVANLVELDTRTIIAIGYNRIIVANDLAAFKKKDWLWDRKWNYAGLDGGGKMAQFINDFYVQDTPNHEMFDVVVLVDGSAIVITTGLIAQFQNYVGVSPDAVEIINDHYIERPSLDAAIVERERMRLNWFPTKHESGASQWVEYVARSGPFQFTIFEDGMEKPTKLEQFTNPGERPNFFCTVIWQYAQSTGDFFTAGETQESAVAVAKRRAVEFMYEKIDPLFDWITNELFLMKNEREN